MWLIFTVVSMIMCALGEMFCKRVINDDLVAGPLTAYFASSFFCIISAVIMWILGLGESGLSPFRILSEHPLIILAEISTFLAAFLTLVALRYIGLSVEAVLSGVSAIFLFFGLVGINVFTGKLESVKGILVPGRLIPIVVIIVLIFMLSGTGEKNNSEISDNIKNRPKKRVAAMIVGILVMLVASVFDAADSLIFAYVIDNGQVGVIDFYIAVSIVDAFFCTACAIAVLVLRRKKGKAHAGFVKKIPLLILIGIFGIASTMTYVIGSDFDAVKLAMLYIIYPVVPLIGARIVLKERYTVKQYICIIGIVVASVVFSLMDYIG